ncbi:MAG: PD-(D/E)XK nuclease family protein [Actinomycetota bacterium]|nr:PD-(D/E)XK nuclease family protein [Actinomycetota bacterium]
MALQRRSSPYGTVALQALREAIDQVQQGDPLAPVTVLVHSNAVGVSARRWLAANGGVAAAQFLTTFRFAELLAGPRLAQMGRRPLSTPVIDVAVRQALVAHPGMFRLIAHHQATVNALRDCHRDLRHLPEQVVQRIANTGSARARDVVRIHRAVQQTLRREWYDEADLLRMAAEAGGLAPTRTVVFLPQRMRPTEAALLQALAAHGEVVVIEGEAAPPQHTRIDTIDASDADDEVREAVRVVATAVHEGTPLHRIAIVWPRNEPYARLVGEHLYDAGIPWNGRSGIALHERLAARLVLDVLRLDRRGVRRADLFTLLAHVPARMADGSQVQRQRWERLTRDAGVAADADWDVRLQEYAAVEVAAQREGNAAAALTLQSFVAELRERLGAPAAVAPWQHWTDIAHTLLHRWLGGHRGVAALPPEEGEAHQAVQAALDRLGRLDALAEPTTRTVFADTLAAELLGAPGRIGRIGVGVHIGPLSFAVGQSFDLVVAVGACEGLLPAPPPPEALLSDSDRALTDGGLALNAEAVEQQRTQLWAVLAGTPRAVVLHPRGDLRATAQRQPSRWIADLVALQLVPARSVPSFAAGIADAGFPATVAQHRLRALSHAVRAGTPLAQHPLAQQLQPLRAGAAMLAARASNLVTEYDGDLGGLVIEPLGSGAVSPTRLEAWVACPHAWFMQYVLGIKPVEQPDEQLQISPRDRGTLVHGALDRFHCQVIEGVLPQPGPQGWTTQHLDALLQCFTEEARHLERLGLVGRTAFWTAEQSRQRHELATWLRHDSDRVVARGATVVASEHRFGRAGTAPAVLALPDGGTVSMLGAVDRIDRCADGSLVVTDHKTGGDTAYKGISDADATAGGTRFQLPAYAAAALAITGAPTATPVLAEYGFFAKAEYKRRGASIGSAQWPHIGEHIAHVLDGIRSGLFIALPGKSQFKLSFTQCEYCDPDNLGTAEQWAEFERKAADPRVLALLGLADDHDTVGGGSDD